MTSCEGVFYQNRGLMANKYWYFTRNGEAAFKPPGCWRVWLENRDPRTAVVTVVR